jgi:hypothetical protein
LSFPPVGNPSLSEERFWTGQNDRKNLKQLLRSLKINGGCSICPGNNNSNPPHPFPLPQGERVLLFIIPSLDGRDKGRVSIS